MKKSKYKELANFLINKNLNGFKKALASIPLEESDDIQTYLYEFVNTYTLSDASFWKLAVIITQTNLDFVKKILFETNFKRKYKNVIHPKYKEQFRIIFNIFCQHDRDIKDILSLLGKFDVMFDKSFLDTIAIRSYKFNDVNHYQLVIDATHPTFNETVNYLTKDGSLNAFYVLALLTLDVEFRNDYHWKPMSFQEIRNLANNIQKIDSYEAKFTSAILYDYCSTDALNEACDAVINQKAKKFRQLFEEIYGNRQRFHGDSAKKSFANKDESVTIQENTNIPEGCIENREKAKIEGISLIIVAYKNEKVAFTEPFDSYAGGILFPQNITYKNNAIPLNIACNIINVLFNSKQKSGYQIIDTTEHQGKKYALLSKELKCLYRNYDISQFELLSEGIECPIEIISSTPHFKGVRILTTGLKGYISHTDLSKIEVNNDTSTFSAKIATIPNNEANPIIFGSNIPQIIKTDRQLEEENNERYSNLFTSLELQNLSAEDKSLIEIMLAEYPSFGKTKENEIINEQKIYCRFNDSSVDSEQYIIETKKILESNNFWVSPRTLGGRHSLFLFNQDSLLIEIEEVNNIFYLKRRFRYGTLDQEAYKIIEGNKLTKLKICGFGIQIFGTYDQYPTDYSALATFTYIDRLNSYFRIKYDLTKKVLNSIYNTAAVFVNQQKYLNYLIDKEKEKTKLQLYFAPNHLKPISGDWQDESVSILIDMSIEEYQMLLGYLPSEGSVDNEIRVNTIDDDGIIIDHCILSIDVNDEYILHFLGQHKNITDYLSNGIKLQGDANIKHLKIQTNALNDFTHDEDSLFRDLLGDSIAIPNPEKYKEIIYLNDYFNCVEHGNNQTIAVKKALSLENHGILLIQGPPGTGKTTTIIEIIRQLVKEKKKVLVCSQSHAAVQNIYEKLEPHCKNILRIDEKDNQITESKNFNAEDYESFLRNNIVLLNRLQKIKDPKEYSWEDPVFAGINYKNEIIDKQYKKLHLLLAKYYNDNKSMDTPHLHQMIDYLVFEAKNMSGSMLETQIYQSKDVILGTCVGVGMNYILRNNTVRFDTVIIDEAAKANLAETLVPMRMGDRYVLVGDDNQLPPYVDQESIKEMMQHEKYNSGTHIDFVQMIQAQNKSLFEYFHYHRNPLFPEECIVTLNYQYRMNPEIGDFISNLFYSGKINNGKGTEKMDIYIPSYPNPVTVIDTTGQRNNLEKTINCSHRNECEAHYICDDILPRIKSVLMDNDGLRLGIISPYSSQCEYIRSLINDKKLRNCVHTIDSIQGMEFDIVIFSFVRSFPLRSNQKVGFVDDMKRLNVSLSRAKRKLIIIGNMSTLANPKAHYNSTTEGIKPLDVFKKLAEMPTKVSIEKSELEQFLSSGIIEGEILNDCSWNYDNNTIIQIIITYKEKDYHFRMKVTNQFMVEKRQTDKLKLKYIGLGKDSRPNFGFASIEEELKYTNNALKIKAECISVEAFPTVTLELNGKLIEIAINRNLRTRKKLKPGRIYVFSRKNGKFLDIDNDSCFESILSKYQIGDKIEGYITNKRLLQYSLYQYFVEIDGFTCACFSKEYLEEDSVHIFLYSESNLEKKQITLKYIRKYDNKR